MKKWLVEVKRGTKTLMCVVNARTADDAVNLAFEYFRAFNVTGNVRRA